MSPNDEVAALLEEFADLLEATGVEYKPQAYRRAAENVRDHPTPVDELAAEGPDAVAEINRVGDAVAAKVVEYVETGSIEELAELRARLPVDMAALTRVGGVGPKTVGTLYEALGVESLDDLEAAARAGEIRDVRGFGEKTEANVLENIPFARQAGERALLGDARPIADGLLERLRAADAVERAEVAGSIRRWKATIGDVDVLVAAGDGDREAAVEAFLDWPAADATIEAGGGKASVRADGTRVDLRVVAPDEFGAALQYFTGSRDHNITVRNRAIERDLKVNEYGVFDVSGLEADDDDDRRAGERAAARTEGEVYAALGLDWIPPELREDNGEVAAAADGDLPELVTPGAVRGDLHTHTDWSDGGFGVEEMLRAAAERGYDYYAVTDHAVGPGVVADAGLDATELAAQADALAEAAAAVDGIEALHGVEANVDAEGAVVPEPAALADRGVDLDLVIASPHSGLRGDATDRLCRAAETPGVDVLGHPTGRLLNQRPGLSVDFDRLAAVAADEGVALEVNANPSRLDCDGDAVRAAVEAGVPVAVNTDAHSPRELDNVRYGVHTARRGWAEAADVINAWPVDELRAFLDA